MVFAMPLFKHMDKNKEFQKGDLVQIVGNNSNVGFARKFIGKEGKVNHIESYGNKKMYGVGIGGFFALMWLFEDNELIKINK